MTSFGWIECVGNADRACYDLQAHATATRERLTFDKPLPAPIKVKGLKVIAKKKVIGTEYKTDTKAVSSLIA